MLVKQIFDLAVKNAIAADPRGKNGVADYLRRIKKDYEGLSDRDREDFDEEKLTNPYLDSRIHFDDGKTQVKRVLAGIDIGDGELLLAERMKEKGQPVDLVITHHPVGKGLTSLGDVMEMSVDVYESYGVPIHLAEKIHEERMRLVGRSIHPSNSFRVVDMARLLKINFINTHTLTDNLVDKYLRGYLAKVKPHTVGDIMEALFEIPEYQEAQKMGFGPRIIAGNAKNRVGKFIIEVTGGTEPSSKIYQFISRAGFSTEVGMHMKEELLSSASEHHLNVVMAGHMSSDSVGMNLFLDELEKKGIEVIPCGGLIRVSRNKGGKEKGKK